MGYLNLHHSLNNKIYLAGSLFVTCLIVGFLSSNIAYYVKLIRTKRPVQPFLENQEVYSIGFLSGNSFVLLISLYYTYKRVINYQDFISNKISIKDISDFYISTRTVELLAIIINTIYLYEFTKTPNSFIMSGLEAKQMFWYGIILCILVFIEMLWNFGVIRSGITAEEKEKLNVKETFRKRLFWNKEEMDGYLDWTRTLDPIVKGNIELEYNKLVTESDNVSSGLEADSLINKWKKLLKKELSYNPPPQVSSIIERDMDNEIRHLQFYKKYNM